MATYTVKNTTIKHGRGKEPAKYYNPGDEIELTEDEARGLSVELTSESEVDINSMTNKALIEALEELGVDVPKKANKDELIALLANASGVKIPNKSE